MKRAALILASLLAWNVAGAVDCIEKVTTVIVHTNDVVYFQTDKTCAAVWCQLAMTTPSANNRAYAALLAAQAADRKVGLSWPNISSCTQQNAAFAAPAFVSVQSN